MDLRQRLEEFANRFGERGGDGRVGGEGPPPALQEDYWRSLRELFTQGVTSRGLLELLQTDPRETLRFFSKEIDFTSLRPRPWYERYPLAVWKIFLAMAYRLSPPRRILFAGAVPILLGGWVFAFLQRLPRGDFSTPPTPFEWTLAAGSLLLFLLILELRDKLALKGDLEVARQIQFGLLPFRPYRRPGLTVDAAMQPANTVGGDYFDVIELAEGTVAVVLGDVAGKGMPAALLMALLQGSLRTLLTAGLRGTALMSKLNAHLHENIPRNRLVTLFYAEVDPVSGRVSLVNAGHNPPFVLRGDGGLERLRATSVALGVVPGGDFEGKSLVLGERDRVFLYTDGITEAFDARDQEYGEERLEAALRASAGLPPPKLLEAVERDVLAFCGSERPRDDRTSMVVGRTPA